MALSFEVYADESGLQRNPPYCVVAGYIASPDQWSRFNDSWTAALSDAGAKPFHATQFFRKRDYQPLIGRLTEIIDGHGLYPIGAGVDVDAFQSLTIGERRFLTGARWWRGKLLTSGAPTKPYYLVFQYLIVEATNRTLEKDGSTIHFTFDQQQILEAKAVETYKEYTTSMTDVKRREKLGGVTFDRASKHPGLQAADMLSHLWYSYMLHGNNMSPVRLQAMQTLTKRRGAMRLFNAQRLEEMLSELSQQERAAIRATL